MTDDELRALVREAIKRHLGDVAGDSQEPVRLVRLHASHARFIVPSGGDVESPCLIEPTVHCTHCGYCQSYGH